MKKLILGLVGAVALLCSSCGSNDYIEYIPFKSDKDGKWGLISPDGKVLFDDEFNEMTAAVNGRFFVKTKKGEWEIYETAEKPEQVGSDSYKQIAPFSADVTPAVKKGEPIKLINRDGEVIADLKTLSGKTVESVNLFINDLAVFKTVEGYYGAIDTKGTVVVEPKYIMLQNASDYKFIAVDKKYEDAFKKGDSKNFKYCVLDKDGKQKFELTIKDLVSVSSGYNYGALTVYIEKDGERKCGLIDEDGNWIVEASSKIERIGHIFDNYFVYMADDALGVMDFDGNIIIRPKYESLWFAKSNRLIALEEDGNYDEDFMLINLDGEQVGDETFGISNTNFGTENTIVKTGKHDFSILDYSNGEFIELDKDVSIYDVYCYPGEEVVESDYVDFDAIVKGLGISKDGFGGMTPTMTPRQAAELVTDSAKAEDYLYSYSVEIEKELGQAKANLKILFENKMAKTLTQTVTEYENYYGYYYQYTREKVVGYKFTDSKVERLEFTINGNDKLDGKTLDLYKALAGKVQALGTVVKKNKNACAVKIDDKTAFTLYNDGYRVRGSLYVNTNADNVISSFNVDSYEEINEYNYEEEYYYEDAPAVEVPVDDTW